jgi:predicted RNase H-like HicB family nuclease
LQELSNDDDDSSEDEEEILEKIKQVFEFHLLSELDEIFHFLKEPHPDAQHFYM